jgi:hypothetical protein
MVLSKSEIALYAYATGRVLPKGTTRKAFRAAISVIPTVSPPVARGAVGVGRAALGAGTTLARRNPLAATALGGLALQQAGVFDPVEDAISREVERRTQQIMAPVELAQTDMFQSAVKSKAKRKVSKYSKAVKVGMAAIKKSKFSGKPGKISNAKSAFKTVNLVASAVNKGKKVANTGIRGVVARAVRKVL